MVEYDVIIIGGGITGAGTARDCALRGLKTLLIERFDLTNGATGRNHGLLHSGARYAVNDRESAAECIRENLILKKIASHCVDDCGGLFISLPEDGLDYQKGFIQACRESGIDARELSPEEAIRLEPSVNPALIGAVMVPDASVDPFRLTTANAFDARLHGADILTYTEVTGFLMEGGRVVGVETVDTRTGNKGSFRAAVTVNAAGIWGAGIASMAGVSVGMFPAKGALLIFGHRVNKMVINRCRKPSNADILVPGDVVCVVGTTSDRIPFEECDSVRVNSDEVRLLLTEGVKLSPVLETTRVLRAYAGVRPLVASDSDPSGRSISRGIVLLDHETRDSLPGFVTITGGKLTTYRLMAEQAADLVCSKLGVKASCKTAELPLPGSDRGGLREMLAGLGSSKAAPSVKAASERHGRLARQMDFKDKSEVVCECEHVTRAEIEYAVKYLDVHNLIDLRRRTRVGMGTCQGTFCMEKVAAVLADVLGCPEKAGEFVRQYAGERWKGMAPVCWGESIREAEYMRKKYGK